MESVSADVGSDVGGLETVLPLLESPAGAGEGIVTALLLSPESEVVPAPLVAAVSGDAAVGLGTIVLPSADADVVVPSASEDGLEAAVPGTAFSLSVVGGFTAGGGGSVIAGGGGGGEIDMILFPTIFRLRARRNAWRADCGVFFIVAPAPVPINMPASSFLIAEAVVSALIVPLSAVKPAMVSFVPFIPEASLDVSRASKNVRDLIRLSINLSAWVWSSAMLKWCPLRAECAEAEIEEAANTERARMIPKKKICLFLRL